MRSFGIILILGGFGYLLIAFNMNVSVSVPYSPYGSVREIANIDLMERRQNHLIVSCLVILIGVLMAIFGKGAETVKSESQIVTGPETSVDYDDERDIANDRYRLWLAARYGLTKNEVFNRFVIDDKTFETLDDALAFANDQEDRKSKQAEMMRAEVEDRRRRIESELLEVQERELEVQEREQAEWNEKKPKVIVGVVLAVVLCLGTYVALRETPEERAAELAASAEAALGVHLPDGSEVIRIETDSLSRWCPQRSSPGGNTLYVLSTPLSAGDFKKLLSDRLGPGEPKYMHLDSDDEDWVWRSDTNEVWLHHSSFGKPRQNVCVATAESTS